MDRLNLLIVARSKHFDGFDVVSLEFEGDAMGDWEIDKVEAMKDILHEVFVVDSTEVVEPPDALHLLASFRLKLR